MAASTPETSPPARLRSLDAYRGFVMLAMASGGLGLATAAKAHAGNKIWELLGAQTDHVAWRGCVFWDLIQPSFIFIVGVAMPFSYASRRAKGEGQGEMLLHALVRSLILIALAVFLSTDTGKGTNFIFTNVLAQIGLGYAFVFMLLGGHPLAQLGMAAVILVNYWAWFAYSPLPGPDFDFTSVGLNDKWTRLTGFAAHWEKNTNPAAAFDRWFLNLFPRRGGRPFAFNEGGYATLNFIPSMATMIFGVLAGEWLQSARSNWTKWFGLFVAGAACLVVGTALDASYCPAIKRIWTPSWAIYSAGWSLWMLAFFFAIIDMGGWRGWAFPFTVVGMNSIAMYVMAQQMKGYVRGNLRTHLGTLAGRTISIPWPGRGSSLVIPLGPEMFDGVNGPIVSSAAVLLVFWLICYAMYRQKIFVRI
jgi:heparan-alpha-glucosaminide N-acetyltransferase